MKNLFILLTFLLLLFTIEISNLMAQPVQLYYQNFSDSSSSLPPNWTNTGTCNWVSNATNPSSGYTGASGGKNVYAATCTGTAQIMVTNINTIGYSNITVIWGGRRDASQSAINLEVDFGSGFQAVTGFADASNTLTWELVNGGTPISLPSGANGISNLKLRWTFINPSDYRMDDFKVFGTAPATKLFITSIIGSQCNTPQQGIPFSVSVQSRDVNNNPVNVSSTTGITLSSTPSGITGTLTGTINVNTNSTTISGVIYNSTGFITITATSTPNSPPGGMNLSPHTSPSFKVVALSTSLGFVNLNPNGIVNNIHPTFSVTGLPADSSACFSGQVTLVQVSAPPGGIMTGTLVRNANSGQAFFNDIVFTQVGTYEIKATSPGLQDAPTTLIYIAPGVPYLVEIKVPMYMNGHSSATDNLFNAFLVELRNLYPNTTYKYFNSVVSGSDGPTSTGAGNVIFVDATSGTFTRTIAPIILGTNSGSFTTSPNGIYRGWFMIEPNSDTRFTGGNDIKYRIILNDGAGGNIPVTYLTTTQQIKVLDWTTSLTTGGSFFAGYGSTVLPKNFSLCYRSDTSLTGGRPDFINVIESKGFSLTGNLSIIQDYRDLVDQQNGKFGFILPRSYTGLYTIEERTLSGGFLMSISSVGGIRSIATSPNGIWPPGVSTINPTNGMNALSVQPVFNLITIINISTVAEKYSLSQNYPNPFNPSTKINFSIPKSALVKLTVYDILGKEKYVLLNEQYPAGSYSVDFNATSLVNGTYFYKLDVEDYSETRRMVLLK